MIAQYNRGNALSGLGEYQEALSCFDAVLEAEPGNAPAHTSKGLTLLKMGMYEDALGCFDRALGREPPIS